MKSYLIKVLWMGNEIVFCDIEAAEDQTLLKLHETIIGAFQLDQGQMAGFTKIDEIHQIEVDYQLEAFDENSSLMKDVTLNQVFEEVGQVIDYTYDFLHEVKFSLEVIEIYDQANFEMKVVKKHGQLPKNVLSEIDPEDAQNILIQAMLGEDEEEEDYEDDAMNDFFDQEDFESLDDYEGLY